MTKDEILAYYDGVKEGLWRHAWWKDGVEYVGNSGTTLREAQAKATEECNKALANL
jgi:hypothetical protein